MARCLGIDGCKDWILPLITSLSPGPEIPHRLPSLLMHDALDVQNEINELFVQKLFRTTETKGLSAMDHGANILAHPSAMSGGCPCEPIWNGLPWSRELLSEMIQQRFPDKISVWAWEDGMVSWIGPNWTPQDCLYHADSLLRTPLSPVRARRRYE